MEMILANGNRVRVTMNEIAEFISAMPAPIPNAYWRHSKLLSEEEVMRFLAGESTRGDLEKVARYILIYTENLAFAAYLFDKSEGTPDKGKEFNMPVIKKLRELYQKVSDNNQIGTDISHTVSEMENTCLKIGADPL